MRVILVTVIFVILNIVSHLVLAAEVRIRQNFDFDWKFTLSDNNVDYSQDPGEISKWADVQLPHDWNIYQDFVREAGGAAGYLPAGTGWYFKEFSLSDRELKDRKITILFDGIFMQSDVWINGFHLGHRPYGYCSIEYDLTPHLKKGRNVVTVRANTEGGRPRWYAGAGIYRHVWLNIMNKIHVPTYGIYVTTPQVSEHSALVNVVTTLENSSNKTVEASVQNIVVSYDGKEITKTKRMKQSLNANDSINICQSLTIQNPELWSIDNPKLYSMVTEIRLGGTVVDRYETPFGIRSFKFDPDKGFILNNKRIKIKGMCLHMDDGSRGVAVPDRGYERRLEILKEYGCNAIRCSHNQPSSEFLDMCDRMGFIVIDEAFDKWKSGYYEKYFDEWWRRDLENMIVRDRNHPSIVLWSIGNELQEAWNDDNVGVERATMLRDFVHSIEPTRPVNLAGQNGHKSKFSGVADVIGYNYLEARMLSDHKKFPDKSFLITEELPYYHGEEGNIRAYSTYNPWNIVRDYDFIAGGFIWTGADHIGESSWPDKGYPNGLFDMCMHEKPRAAYHRSQWNDTPIVRIAVYDNNLDMAHGRDLWQWPKMASIWNFPQHYEGMIMQVNTITNCDEVELYFDGKLMGRNKTSDYPNNTIVWNLPYKKGTIKAIGYNAKNIVAEHEIKTSQKAEILQTIVDRTTISADGQDLAYIDISLLDKDGILSQTDNRNINVYVEGNGRFLGLDNGDVRREKTFFRNSLPTYFGRALACVQASRTAGKIKVIVTAEGIATPSIIEISTNHSTR